MTKITKKITKITNQITNQTIDPITESKVFSEWDTQVDCNNCGHYWDDSCNGTPKDKARSCNSYIATRRVVIPEQIKELEMQIKNLKISVNILWIVILILSLCTAVIIK